MKIGEGLVERLTVVDWGSLPKRRNPHRYTNVDLCEWQHELKEKKDAVRHLLEGRFTERDFLM